MNIWSKPSLSYPVVSADGRSKVMVLLLIIFVYYYYCKGGNFNIHIWA